MFDIDSDGTNKVQTERIRGFLSPDAPTLPSIVNPSLVESLDAPTPFKPTDEMIKSQAYVRSVSVDCASPNIVLLKWLHRHFSNLRV